jgi:hypothetical protein
VPSFEENKASHRWEQLLLEFPGVAAHDLLAKGIYEDAGDDEELNLELIPSVYSHPGVSSNSINTIHYAAWKVARTGLGAWGLPREER